MLSTATPTADRSAYQDTPVDVKLVLSSLWVSILFVFAYVDIFGFFRADVLDAAHAGELSTSGLPVSQGVLIGTLVYVLLPSLMVVLSLVLPARTNRVANIALALVYAATIVAACVGETWAYFLAGSAVEVVLLMVLARTAWTWPRA